MVQEYEQAAAQTEAVCDEDFKFSHFHQLPVLPFAERKTKNEKVLWLKQPD